MHVPLIEEVVTRSLSKFGGTSTSSGLDNKVDDRDERSSDRLVSQDFTSDNMLSSTVNSAHCIPPLSFKETTGSNDLDSIYKTEIVNDASLVHGKITRDEVINIRSDNAPGLVHGKCLENIHSSCLDDMGKANVSIENQNKAKAKKDIFPVIPRESVLEIHGRGKQVVTPLKMLETIPNSADEYIIPLNQSTDSTKDKGEFSRAGRILLCLFNLRGILSLCNHMLLMEG